MIACPSCGASNDDDANFCGDCREFLEWNEATPSAPARTTPPPAPVVTSDEPDTDAEQRHRDAAEASRREAAAELEKAALARTEAERARVEAEEARAEAARAEQSRVEAEQAREAAQEAIRASKEAAERDSARAKEATEAAERRRLEEEKRAQAAVAAAEAAAHAAREEADAARLAAVSEVEEARRVALQEAEAAKIKILEEAEAARQQAIEQAQQLRDAAAAEATAVSSEREVIEGHLAQEQAALEEANRRIEEAQRLRREAEERAEREGAAAERAAADASQAESRRLQAEREREAAESERRQAAEKAAQVAALVAQQSAVDRATETSRRSVADPSEGLPERITEKVVEEQSTRTPALESDPRVVAELGNYRPGDVVCDSCRKGNPADRTFCKRCGHPLADAPEVKRSPWWRRIFEREPTLHVAGERLPKHQRMQTRGQKKDLRNLPWYKRWRERLRSVQRGQASLTRGLALLAALGVGGMVTVGPWRATAKDWAEERLDDVAGFFNPQYDVIKAITAEASSQIDGHPGIAAVDDQRPTYWAEGAEGVGIGERLFVTFADPVNIDVIGIWPGVPDEEFISQPRPRMLHVVFDNGATVDLEIEDEFKFQTFDIGGAQEITTIEFQVLDVWQGQTGTDMAISEIEFRTKQ